MGISFARGISYRMGVPVLPGALPFLGHFVRAYREPMELMQEARAALGPVFWAKLNPKMWIIVVTGKTAIEVLKDKSLTAEGYSAFVPEIFGDSMITNDGARHAHLRSALSPLFSPRGLTENKSIDVVVETITEMVERWVDKKRIDVHTETQMLTLDIILRIMGVPHSELAEWRRQYRELVLSIIQIPVHLPGFPLYRADKARRWIDARMLESIGATRRGVAMGGLFGRLVEARDDSGDPLTDEEILDNLRTLAFAGHETTSSTLAWLVFMLARRPDLWRNLLDEACGSTAVPSTAQALSAFPFAEALLRETMRYYAPTTLAPRTTTGWTNVHDYRLPAGTRLSVALCTLGRDPELHPDPERFDPTRWLGRKTPPSVVELANFGVGHHFCLGYHLAVAEGVLFGVILARALAKRGLSLRIADGPAPMYRLFSHPRPQPRILLEAS